MDPKLALYGTAAERSQLGRFQVYAGPTSFIPIWAAGPMYTAAAAQLLGASGSAYRYGTTKVGGTTNMLSNGNYLYPAIGPLQLPEGGSVDVTLLLGGLGAGNYDATTNARHSMVVTYPNNNGLLGTSSFIFANGEFASYATSTTVGANGYGARSEAFTTAGTVSATNGLNTITGAGTSFLTAALATAYAYTPSLNRPLVGDIIEIDQGGLSAYYRIASITDGTHLTIFPTFQGSTAAGLAYAIRRTGYGSWCRPVIASLGSGNSSIIYYAGNVLTNQVIGINGFPAGFGTIEAISLSGGNLHFMCPQNSANQDIQAVDVAFYKSYMLYGAGSTIGWSVAGFPTSLTTAFGATDFPAGNISAPFVNDCFVAFEYIADQLVAILRNSIWLIVPTGGVPEVFFLSSTGGYRWISEGDCRSTAQ